MERVSASKRALPWILALLAAVVCVLFVRYGDPLEADAVDAPAEIEQATRDASGAVLEADEDAETIDAEIERVVVDHETTPVKTSESLDVLHGRVVDEAGRPLGGVALSFWAIVGAKDNEELLSRKATSRSDGSFTVRDFEAEFANWPVEAELEAYTLLSTGPIERTVDNQGWAHLEIVMSALGRVAVTVMDQAGNVIVHMPLVIEPIEAERSSLGLDFLVGDDYEVGERTDDSGRAVLDVVPGRKLRVTLSYAGWDLVGERYEGQEIRFDGLEGTPIIAQEGETLELVAVMAASLMIEGTVLFADGRPVSGADLRLFDRELDIVAFNESRLDTEADEKGRYEMRLFDVDLDQELTLLAADGWWWSNADGGIKNARIHRFTPRDATESRLKIDLVLDRMLELSGRVLDEDGKPFAGTVWAMPADSEYLLGKTDLGLLAAGPLRSGGDGSFRIAGLPPGLYDIVIKRGQPRTYYRFGSFTAGERNIELEIVDNRSAMIRLRVANPEPGMTILPLLRKHHYRRPSERNAVRASSPVHVREYDSSSWPSQGQLSDENAEGRAIHVVGDAKLGSTHDFEMQQPGWYSVGARAWDSTGRAFATLLSAPQYLDEGEFEFVLHLAPSTSLSGIAPLIDGAETFVLVLDPSGQHVPFGTAPFAPTDARGRFEYGVVPVGRLSVRIGTWQQLEQGSFRQLTEVDAHRGQQAVAEY